MIPKQLFDKWLQGGWKQIAAVLISSIIVFFIISLFFLYLFEDEIGVHFPNGAKNEGINKFWQLFYYYADPGCQMSARWETDKSRWIGLVVSTFGSIFMSGLLISSITNVFERRADKWRKGFSYYKLKNHIVIIGSDQMVSGLVNQLCEDSNNTIVVMTSTDVERMRNSLYATLNNKNDHKRIIVNYGSRDSEHYLNNINIAYAKEVYILGDTSEFDDIESFHDSLNVQCVTLIAKICKHNNRKDLPCHVLFDYKTTYHVFQYADLSPEITDYIDFHPFNFYDFWARKVLVAGSAKEENIKYKPLDYIPITSKDSDKFVHLIIIGMSKMGQAIALQAAHIAHFPNYRKKKTKITFIDRNCKEEMGEFKQKCGELFKVSRSRYIDADAWLEAKERYVKGDPSINEERFITQYGLADEYQHLVDKDDEDKEFIDIEWEFIKGNDHNSVVQDFLQEYVSNENAIITVAVCLNITHISLRSAMHLPNSYYDKEIPILVQQRKTSTMASTLNGKGFDESKRENLLYKNITPFGMIYDCYDLRIASSLEVCKRIAATYDYYFRYGKNPTILDSAEIDKIWDNTSITKRWSNIFSATSIPTKLRCIGIKWDINSPNTISDLTESEIDLLAEIEHNRWNMEELLLGYRPVNEKEDKIIDADKSKKGYYKKRYIHYDIRPYYGLKEDEKGIKVEVYDKVLVKALPLILDIKTKSNS